MSRPAWSDSAKDFFTPLGLCTGILSTLLLLMAQSAQLLNDCRVFVSKFKFAIAVDLEMIWFSISCRGFVVAGEGFFSLVSLFCPFLLFFYLKLL